MSPLDYKQIEGPRIQQVLGAIGALPAAMLVFGDGPSTSAAGAPLFTAAIVFVIGALMNWNYTDDAYHMNTIPFTVPDKAGPDLEKWQADLMKAGTQFQHRTYAYGVLSLLSSVLGVAGVYSTLRTGISVNLGFVAAIAAAAAVSFDIVALGMKRNELGRRGGDLPKVE